MKKNKWFGLALVATMMGASFSACSNDAEEVLAQESEIKLTSEITPSRVTNQDLQSTQIVEGQQVGVYITGAKSEHNNVAWTAGSDGALSNTGEPIYWGSEDITITAVHPYSTGISKNLCSFSVLKDQSENEAYLNSDILFATKTAEKTSDAIELTFEHMLSKINVSLTSTDIPDLKDATIYICGTYLDGSFKYNTKEVTAYDSYTVEDIKAATIISEAKASAIIVPQTITSGTVFIRVEHNNKSFYYKLSADKTFASGKSYNFNLNLNEKKELILVSSAITPWETPEEGGTITEEVDEEQWEIVKNSTAGSLSTTIGEQKNSISSLKIIGSLNSDDLTFIGEMTDREYNSGNLRKLDLSEATIVDNNLNIPYYTPILESIIVPNDIVEINLHAGALSSIVLPNSVTTINLSSCHSLVSVSLSEEATTINLSGCSSLTSLDIPDNATTIDLSGCSSLTSVDLPESATTINLSGCTKIESIEIPTSVQNINLSNTGLTSIDIPDDMDIIYSDTGYTTIPNGSKSINLKGCKSLTSVEIPINVTTIGYKAFYECTSMTSINIPSGVKTIDESAFVGCSSLSEIMIAEGVENIGNTAFVSCKALTEITLPSSIKTIGSTIFGGCSSLTRIYSEATTPPNLTSDAFYGISNIDNLIIYVPASSVDVYKAATGWQDLNIQPIEE